MLVKYSSYHTVAIIIICIIISVFGGSEGFSFNAGDFDSKWKEILFTVSICFILVPIAIHSIAMCFHMLKHGKWLWFLVAIFIAFGSTVPYYFLVYRGKSAI